MWALGLFPGTAVLWWLWPKVLESTVNQRCGLNLISIREFDLTELYRLNCNKIYDSTLNGSYV